MISKDGRQGKWDTNQIKSVTLTFITITVDRAINCLFSSFWGLTRNLRVDKITERLKESTKKEWRKGIKILEWS
jgi:hypothetical protein